MRGRASLLSALFLLSALSVGLPTDVAGHHDRPIQPGAIHITGNGVSWCTFNAVFGDDSGNLFIGSAGHCTGGQGTRISIPDHGEIGTVVYRELSIHDRSDPELVWKDFSLIKIDADKHDMVESSLRGWGGPTGVQTDFTPGQTVFQYGNGHHVSMTDFPRSRPGLLQEVIENGSTANDHHMDGWFLAQTPVTGGDSGSLLITGDGMALGVSSIPSFLLGEPGIVAGPTFTMILKDLREFGLDVDIVTAPFQLEQPLDQPEDVLDWAMDRLVHCSKDPVSLDMWQEGCVRNPNAWPFAPFVELPAEAPNGTDGQAKDDVEISRPYTFGQGNVGGSVSTPAGNLMLASNSASVQTTMPVREMSELAAVTVTAADGATDRVFLTVCVHTGENPHICSNQQDTDLVASGFDSVTIRAPIPAATWITSYVHTFHVELAGDFAFATEGRVTYQMEYA